MAIDTIYIMNSDGQEAPYPIGAGAENVIYNENLPGTAPADSVHNKIKTYDVHINTKAVSSSNGVHGIRYYDNKLQALNSNNTWVEAAGTGDMTKAVYDPNNDGIIGTAQGGTGNSDGYIRTGQQSGRSLGERATAEGFNVVATGPYSHAEGFYTTTIGEASHAEGSNTYADVNGHAEGHSTSAGGSAHAEGSNTQALGSGSHAEGYCTQISAVNENAHAEGYYTSAYGHSTANHVEGGFTFCNSQYGHAEGYYTYVTGPYAHAEGSNTSAREDYSHAEGYSTSAAGDGTHTEGGNTTAKGTYGHAEGYQTYAYGEYSHAEGMGTTAYGDKTHAEGEATSARGEFSHAEGKGTYSTFDAVSGHVEGYHTTVDAPYAHVEGQNTIAKGLGALGSHVEGFENRTEGKYAHAEGSYNVASNYASHAGGHLNAAMTTGGSLDNTTGTAFVIGNGTSSGSNAFSIQYDGTVAAAGRLTASNVSDYAEFFEWSDNNINNEDRVGHFVTFDTGKKVKIASAENDYILGIVSGAPFVLGNGDCDVWNGMVMRDKFGRIIYEPAPKMKEIVNEETGEVTYEQEVDEEGNSVYQGTRPVYNPEYDPTQPYITRWDRPEWAPIGMLGVLSVVDDGTCEVNGYCKCAEGGIATATEGYDRNTYRVIERIDETTIKVVFR